jgi:hypothetical protein
MAKAVPSPLALALAAVAVAALLLLCRGAEARVLLTLDDFGAVGDGIANDTQVRTSVRGHVSTLDLLAWQRWTDGRSVPESAGSPGRVGRRVQLQPGGRPRRAGREGLPDLAGAALRALQEEAQAAGTSRALPLSILAYVIRTRCSLDRSLINAGRLVWMWWWRGVASRPLCALDFRRDRGAVEPRRVGRAGPHEVALRLRRRRPVRQRRRHHRRHGAAVVGQHLQAQEDPGK